MEVLKGFGRLFYLISPNETAVERVESVPDYAYTNAIPYYFTLIFLEYVIQWWKDKPRARLNDSIVSMSNGAYYALAKLLTRGIESYAYITIYNEWRLYSLAWNSPLTWYIAAIGVDFGYYWFHRASHEINFFWTSHQVHHSSEDYNLTTALRQSGIQGYLAWILYLPLAFFVPPPLYMIHQQFSLLYQFWIHTELVDSIGPLEYVLNTPRHHRIHHGSNRYCLDKNYAGVLIIWDRMFGTFAEEKAGEKIVYGLVEEVNSFNPFWLQFFYLPKHLSRMSELDSIQDKISVLAKGPGWSPGKPRLGDPMDCPEVPIRKKFNVKIPTWQNVYVLLHFLAVILELEIVSKHSLGMNQLHVIAVIFYILLSLSSIGFILEKRRIGIFTEVLRCAAACLVAVTSLTDGSFAKYLVLIFFCGSAAVWLVMPTLIPDCDIKEKNGKKKN